MAQKPARLCTSSGLGVFRKLQSHALVSLDYGFPIQPAQPKKSGLQKAYTVLNTNQTVSKLLWSEAASTSVVQLSQNTSCTVQTLTQAVETLTSLYICPHPAPAVGPLLLLLLSASYTACSYTEATNESHSQQQQSQEASDSPSSSPVRPQELKPKPQLTGGEAREELVEMRVLYDVGTVHQGIDIVTPGAPWPASTQRRRKLQE